MDPNRNAYLLQTANDLLASTPRQIRITSTLTPNQRRRINRACATGRLNIAHDGPNCYHPTLSDDSHAAAKFLMLAAGRTFDYELL